VVNYRLWADTKKLVRSLVRSRSVQDGKAEVVVVDNHSPAHPILNRLRRWPGVSMRRCGENRGFAGGVNEGCRLSTGDWVLVLNPDVRLPRGFMPKVLALIDELGRKEPQAGIVGFQLRNADGSRQLSAGPLPTLFSTFARLVLPRARRKYAYYANRRRAQVPWVTGCCFLARRDCLTSLGGLDGDYFLYYEDVDLCLRARQQGWKVLYEPSLRVKHLNPLHGRRVPAHLRLLTRHALLTYAVKHWPDWQVRLLSRVVECEARWRGHCAARVGDDQSVDLFAAMRHIAAEMAKGDVSAAKERLRRVIGREERLHAS
jgi:GT2 family glycosyltransferase